MEFKIEYQNTIKNEYGITAKQIEFFPRLSFYWDDTNFCLGIGWLMFSFDFWYREKIIDDKYGDGAW